MFLAIDRVSKFIYVEFHDNAQDEWRCVLRNAIKAFPYTIHTILTDNGMAFADLPKNRNGSTLNISAPTSSIVSAPTTLSSTSYKALSSLDQRPSRAHEWTIKDATTNVFHYPNLESLKAHVLAFVRLQLC